MLAMLLGAFVVSSAPRLSIQYTAGVSNEIALLWDSVVGKQYNLLSAEHLNSPAWRTLNGAPLVATTDSILYHDTNAGSSAFYKVVELAPALAPTLTFSAITTQTWITSDTWVPANLSQTVSGSKTLITLATWWEAAGAAYLPTDSNGTFLEALNPQYERPQDPMISQIAYQPNAAEGVHTVTPDIVGSGGDGYFILLEVEGLATNSPVRDKGHAREWHQRVGPGDPNAIQTMTVSTDGAAAEVGDFAVAVFGIDCWDANINASLPEGWTSLGVGNDARDNICYRACYKVVTEPGTQTVRCDWTSNSAFVVEAGIVIFKAASPGPSAPRVVVRK